MSLPPRLVSVLGAECTGKTALCTRLAQVLPAVFVPEYLRLWCEQRGRTPSCDEQVLIVDGHLQAERAALQQAAAQGLGWVIADAGPLLTAVYSLEYFDDDRLLAAALEHQRGYALTLVTADDLEWQADGIQRDGPQRRASAQARLLGVLAGSGVRYRLVSGSADRRLGTSLQALRDLHFSYHSHSR